MTLFHKPGWTQANGHTVRSRMEASLCDHLSARNCPHIHPAPEALSFEITIAPRRHALFVPSIVLTELRSEGRIILIEPIDSVRPGGGLRRLRGFRMAHFTDYFMAVVARRSLHVHIPEDAYDLLVPLDDFVPLDAFLESLR
jgi:hypothetical protein